MPSQNNSGRQYNKEDAVTVVATATLAANRFVAYDGGYPSVAGGAKDMQGVSESAADIGEAVSVITEYSALLEAGEPIAQFALVKTDTGGTGKAMTGTVADNCGRALGAAIAAGQLLEVQLYERHVHA